MVLAIALWQREEGLYCPVDTILDLGRLTACFRIQRDLGYYITLLRPFLDRSWI